LKLELVELNLLDRIVIIKTSLHSMPSYLIIVLITGKKCVATFNSIASAMTLILIATDVIYKVIIVKTQIIESKIFSWQSNHVFYCALMMRKTEHDFKSAVRIVCF